MHEPSPHSSSSVADKLIDRALVIVTPLVRLLVAYGVTYPRFAAALKRAFFDAALIELHATGRKQTDSAISLLSGLQRRDTRILGRERPGELPAKSERVSISHQVALRWASLPDYLDEDDIPLDLPFALQAEGGASFSALAQSISRDVHPAAVLDEMQRLGIAHFDGMLVRRVSDTFVPAQFDELTKLMAQSTRDHIAAAVANVRGREPKFLEYSLFSDELHQESIEALHTLTRSQARLFFKRARAAAIEKSIKDRERGFGPGQEMRMRIGVYFYADPMQRDPATDSAPPDGERKTK